MDDDEIAWGENNLVVNLCRNNTFLFRSVSVPLEIRLCSKLDFSEEGFGVHHFVTDYLVNFLTFPRVGIFKRDFERTFKRHAKKSGYTVSEVRDLLNSLYDQANLIVSGINILYDKPYLELVPQSL